MTSSPLAQLQQDMSGFQKSCILAALAELDIPTTILKNSPCSSRELAQLCDCDERALPVLLDAACALGYLEKSGIGCDALYSVPLAFSELLNSESPISQIPYLRHLACVMRSWARLAWTVRDGEPHRGEASILGADEDRVSFIMAMNSIGLTLIDSVIASLEQHGVIDTCTRLRILDVGGASGTYAEAFLKKIPDSFVTIFDLPQGIAQARQRFDNSSFAERVSLVEGDFTLNALPHDFDFAWVSAIIHQLDRQQSRDLYANIFNALLPGGTIAIRDFVMEESRTAPVGGALFGVNMLAQTPRGMVYTFSEIKEDLEDSGFTCVEFPVQVPTMCAVVTAKKPE